MDDVSDYGRFDFEDAQLMINSGTRDASTFPEASEYTIDLSAAPFKNVVGVSLLSASIPRSGYVVDDGKSVVKYAVGNPPYEEANVTSATISSGDYNLPQICDALGARLAPAAITVVPLTNPAEISNKIVFLSSQPFSVILDRDTLGGKIGFGRSVNATDIAAGYYSGTPAWEARNFVDSNVYVATAFASNASSQAFVGPRPYTFSTPLYAANVLSQRFTVQAGGFAESLSLTVAYVTSPITFFVRVKDSAGNVVSTGNVVASAGALNIVVPLANTPNADVIAKGSVAEIELSVSTNCSVYSNPPNVPVDSENSLSRGGTVISTSLAICGTLTVLRAGYRVISPGVVDLTGDRFLTIRCPEVESYIVRSERIASETTHPGIGLLTLGAYGFNEARLDFYNYRPRVLSTPIGRLSKMTIRLQAEDGSTYPTRGCDHTMLLNVRYLVPKRAPPSAAESGLLSPGYSSDMWKYRANTDARARPGQFRRVMGP
jgi:hypothetical protein